MQISIYTRRGRHRPVKSEKYSADHCVFVVSFFVSCLEGEQALAGFQSVHNARKSVHKRIICIVSIK